MLVDRALSQLYASGDFAALYRSGAASSTSAARTFFVLGTTLPHEPLALGTTEEHAMIQRSMKRISMRALMVDDELGTATAEGRAARALVQELQAPRHRSGRSDVRRRRHIGRHLGLCDPRRA